MMCLCMCCVVVPPIPRPSEEKFIEYAIEGEMEQVAVALLHYPNLINIQDSVSVLCYCDEDYVPSFRDSQLRGSTLADIEDTCYPSPSIQSKLTRNRLRIDGNLRSETCSQSYIVPYRRHNKSANTAIGCYNVTRLRNNVCKNK